MNEERNEIQARELSFVLPDECFVHINLTHCEDKGHQVIIAAEETPGGDRTVVRIDSFGFLDSDLEIARRWMHILFEVMKTNLDDPFNGYTKGSYVVIENLLEEFEEFNHEDIVEMITETFLSSEEEDE